MRLRRPRGGLVLEYALMAAVVASIAWTAWFFHENRYLPQPFFYEPYGTFMDWYSLALWGQIPGAFDSERTIYPPLSFVLLKIFALPRCYTSFVSETARDCDPVGIIVLSATVVLNAVLTFLAYRKHDRSSYIPRAIAMSFGLPMLYAFERGNLVLMCYTAMLLAFGPLLKSARLRWFFAGVAFNFKVYLIGALLAPLLRRNWLRTEGMLIAGIAVYLATWLILGEGSPTQFLRNLLIFADRPAAASPLDLWYAGSFMPMISLLKGEAFPITTLIDSRSVDLALLGVTVFLRTTQVMIVVAAVAIWLRPESIPLHRAVYLATAMALSVSEAGGYTQILLLFFIFMEKWEGIGRPIAIVLAYGLCIIGEYVLVPASPLTRASWPAGGALVIVEFGVGLTPFLRVFAIHTITICLACVTMRRVWLDLREQGFHGWRRTGSRAAIGSARLALPAADNPS